MPNKEWTINGLQVETGINARTLGKLLADVEPVIRGERNFYKVRDVIDAIKRGGLRESEAEHTRLLKNRADHEALRVAKKAVNWSRRNSPIKHGPELWQLYAPHCARCRTE